MDANEREAIDPDFNEAVVRMSSDIREIRNFMRGVLIIWALGLATTIVVVAANN